jgi:hypothetical protein
MRTIYSVTALILLGACALVGCGGSDDFTDPTPPGSLDAAVLATTAGVPGARIGIEGLPSAKTYANYAVVFLGPDGTDLFTMPVEAPDGDLPWFLAPFHPSSPATGGGIRLRIVAGNTRSPELSLDLGGLPEAPGRFQQFVDRLRSHIDQRAVAAGTSFDQLAAQDAEDVQMRLLPLKFAQLFVDDPGHPHSLARIADGTSAYLDATQRDMLDRLFAYSNIDSLVQADIDHMGDPLPPVLLAYGEGTAGDLAKRSCVEAGPIISSAPQLAEAMRSAYAAQVAIDPNAATGQILAATGLALGAAAFVPALSPVAAVAGAGLYAYQTARDFTANTHPSEFVSLDFQLDRAWLPEDETGFAQWYDVYAVAKSNGWVADKAIFDAVMQLVGARLGATQAGRIRDSEFLRDAALADVGMSVGFFLDGQPSGVVEFCSQQWRIDITDLPYSEGRAVVGRVSTSGFREIRPVMVGEDVIKVRAVPSQFGYRHIEGEQSIEVRAILVVATPEVVYVQNAGDLVAITTTIENANDERLYWDNQQGIWDDGIAQATNGPGTRPLLTPVDEGLYPFLVTVESLSRDGLRADNNPPRVDVVTVRLQQARVLVDPGYACVLNGETRAFSATVEGLQNTAVTWSLVPVEPGGPVIGSLDASGLYTAPGFGSGTVLVKATSVEDPTVYGLAAVDAGVCRCSWTLTVDVDGSWLGDAATHAYASDWGIFQIQFDGDGYGGSCVVLAGGPDAGVTGSWPCTFTFITESRAWSAGDASLGTSATLTVFEHDAQMVSEVSGVAASIANGEAVLRNFRLTLRSADVNAEESICGED